MKIERLFAADESPLPRMAWPRRVAGEGSKRIYSSKKPVPARGLAFDYPMIEGYCLVKILEITP